MRVTRGLLRCSVALLLSAAACSSLSDLRGGADPGPDADGLDAATDAIVAPSDAGSGLDAASSDADASATGDGDARADTGSDGPSESSDSPTSQDVVTDISCGDCPLGCAPNTTHCNVMYPSGEVLPGDVGLANTTSITIGADTVLHGDTGGIDAVRGTGTGVANGIGFRVSNGVAIFSFGNLTLPQGVKLHLAGPNSVALVSTHGILLDTGSVVDGQGSCQNNAPGPGGSPGGADGTDGQGLGKGKAGSPGAYPGSGGGGAFGLGGGASGNTQSGLGGQGGPSWGSALLVPLVGGSGGGAGGNSAGSAGSGGGGGGAVQLVAGERMDILGGINVGGCGGRGGVSAGGGGGGGSGGAILLESPQISVTGILAANGGGGGEYGQTAGANGALGDQPAPGAGGVGAGVGGAGGAVGVPAANGTAGSAGGGGGGGGVGRIRLNTRTGLALTQGAVLSPSFADLVVTQGQIDLH